MITFKSLFEDARDAGYPHELYTPRSLGEKDYRFVKINSGREVGSEVLKFDGTPIKGSVILQNTDQVFQYTHIEKEESEYHFESVEMYRDLWNSIHIPINNAQS